MIDVERDIFNLVAQAVREKYPKAYVTSEYVKSPPSFPCACIVEADNVPLVKSQSNECTENHATLLYTVNTYSNKGTKRKSECREIAAYIDSQFLALGFLRTMLKPIPNEEDSTVYRMVGEYKAVVSKDKVIYRR